VLALICSITCFPLVLRFAKKHAIVDCPNARKNQSEPVPVLGGLAFVLGMCLPMAILAPQFQPLHFLFISLSILTLLIIGTIDDVRGLSVWIRFVLEIIIIWIIIWQPNVPNPNAHIDSLHGLWNRFMISPYTAIPLTIVAGVGILNSINLIDGVDGYSSGFGIVANILFAVVFLLCHEYIQGILALITAMSLFPFYLHNVFGKKSKMYLGDGGSLVIGIIMVWNVFTMLSSTSPCILLEEKGVGLVAFSLAILSIPVFDTIRVMLTRLYHGGSPFLPDQTHLHHLFLEMHFSHVATSTCIILTNLAIVAVWYFSYALGASITLQFYIVVGLSFLCTFGFYHYMQQCKQNNSPTWKRMCRLGNLLNLQSSKLFRSLEQFVDIGC